jgi:hypothetical protein
MEMLVTTPTTACRRLAFKYRNAKKSSNRMGLLRLRGKARLGRAPICR